MATFARSATSTFRAVGLQGEEEEQDWQWCCEPDELKQAVLGCALAGLMGDSESNASAPRHHSCIGFHKDGKVAFVGVDGVRMDLGASQLQGVRAAHEADCECEGGATKPPSPHDKLAFRVVPPVQYAKRFNDIRFGRDQRGLKRKHGETDADVKERVLCSFKTVLVGTWAPVRSILAGLSLESIRTLWGSPNFLGEFLGTSETLWAFVRGDDVDPLKTWAASSLESCSKDEDTLRRFF
jgi:hypothetical protein